MKRWLTHLVISSYLGILLFGVVAHAAHFLEGSHPGMYFIVWDMFCGWSGYSNRIQVVAEGHSGKFYAVTPTPWKEFHPYSDHGRENYDPFGTHAVTVGLNVLRHTEHEPIQRIFVFEKFWAHKYNLPPHLWATLSETPKQPRTYYHLRSVHLYDGTVVQDNAVWSSFHTARMMLRNPRLVNSRPGYRFALNPRTHFTAADNEDRSAAPAPQIAIMNAGN